MTDEPFHLPHSPAESLQWMATSELVPSARNARTHSDAQVDEIAASIREWGWTVPVLIDESGELIAGHGRLLAAQKLGLERVPAMTAEGWTEAAKRAYRIADNKLAEHAGWDTELLRVELEELQAADFDIGLVGFTAEEMSALQFAGRSGHTDPDEAPDPPAEPVTQAGELWHLGHHRLICGDATDEATVQTLLGDVRPLLMVTDPPYGVEYDASWRNRVQSVGSSAALGKVENDNRIDWKSAWSLFPGDVIYVWHAGTWAIRVGETLTECGFELRAQIIWAKSRLVPGRGHYHWQHEPCWYAVRRKGHWQGSRKESTLWQIDKPQKSETGHSTQKPVECMRRPIVNNSAPGQPVYDPFVGSGTTIIAAEMEGRACYAIELSPAYVDVCIQRWEAFTGEQATRASDGATFAALSSGQAEPQESA